MTGLITGHLNVWRCQVGIHHGNHRWTRVIGGLYFILTTDYTDYTDHTQLFS